MRVKKVREEPKTLKITVVTPSLNQGEYIERTIQSVLQQKYPNLEYWVIDGGSTDNTSNVLKKYGDRISWVSQKDDGQSDAVNKGIEKSTGEIIGWLNSDDTYNKRTLWLVNRYFQNHPEVEFLYGDGDYIDSSDRVIKPYPIKWIKDGRELKKALVEGNFLCQPSVFFRRSVVDKIGFLNTRLHYCMDYDYWLRALDICEFGFLNNGVLANLRMYPDNKSLANREAMYEEMIETTLKHFNYVPWKNTLGGYAKFKVHGEDQFFNHTQETPFKAYLICGWMLLCYNLFRKEGQQYLFRSALGFAYVPQEYEISR